MMLLMILASSRDGVAATMPRAAARDFDQRHARKMADGRPFLPA
jgi:hypothetical protein